MRSIAVLYCSLALSFLTGCSTLEQRFTVPPERYLAQNHNPHIDCRKPGYRCENIPEGATWESRFPNPEQRHMVMALNHTNKSLQQLPYIMVPKRLHNTSLLAHSPLPKRTDRREKHVLVQINRSVFAAYDDNGELVHWGPISAGVDCNESPDACITRVGDFTVYHKRGEKCFSSKYPLPNGGGPMPWCMFFDGGIALHGGHLPGHHASHGCVRLLKPDAEWLYNEFIQIGTPVVVKI